MAYFINKIMGLQIQTFEVNLKHLIPHMIEHVSYNYE